MQHVPRNEYGFYTPPASPGFDNPHRQQHCAINRPPTPPAECTPHFVPLQPQDRLGRYLGDSLQLVGILGNGAYGVVYQAVDVNTNVQYAVKTLSRYNADGTPLDRRQLAFQTREIRLHYAASGHRNVVSMLKIVDDPECMYVVLEYCPEGDLFSNITERGRYVGNDAMAKDIFLQILDAVEHCHSRGIFHRDLKPENILVTDHGATVKLADFGLATNSDKSEDYGCGSTFYMSPECLDPSSRRPFYYCAPNDIWSLGVILVNLTCGRNPWKSASFEDSTYRAFAKNPGFLKTILPLSDELNDILGMIFTREPEKRITLPELRQRILNCNTFTAHSQPAPQHIPAAVAAPIVVPEVHQQYVHEEAIIDDDYSDSDSEAGSPDFSDCGSDSSISSVPDMEEDYEMSYTDSQGLPPTPPPEARLDQFRPAIVPSHTPLGYHHPVTPPPEPTMISHCHAPPASKGGFHFFAMNLFESVRGFAQPQLAVQHHPAAPFPQHVPIFNALQGCY